jgi:hypothetical protein
MFLVIPYHALPRPRKATKSQCPPPCSSAVEAYREIVPALRRQVRGSSYFVKRELSCGAAEVAAPAQSAAAVAI